MFFSFRTDALAVFLLSVALALEFAVGSICSGTSRFRIKENRLSSLFLVKLLVRTLNFPLSTLSLSVFLIPPSEQVVISSIESLICPSSFSASKTFSAASLLLVSEHVSDFFGLTAFVVAGAGGSSFSISAFSGMSRVDTTLFECPLLSMSTFSDVVPWDSGTVISLYSFSQTFSGDGSSASGKTLWMFFSFRPPSWRSVWTNCRGFSIVRFVGAKTFASSLGVMLSLGNIFTLLSFLWG